MTDKNRSSSSPPTADDEPSEQLPEEVSSSPTLAKWPGAEDADKPQDESTAATMIATEDAVPDTLSSSVKLFENIATEHPSRYLFKREIGAGGIGKVDLAHDTHIGRDVAIKQLLPQFVRRSHATADTGDVPVPSESEVRFLTEARITGQLAHPGIVPVYEMARKADGRIYYAMKLVEGKTLTSEIRGRSLIERLELLPHFLEVCNAIAYAHDKGVIHRDLKPENIMLGRFGETIVLDWGLARKQDSTDLAKGELAKAIAQLRDELHAEHLEGAPLGTPQYMPPEQARGALDEVDKQSDVYALGALLYELLTGCPPYTGSSPFTVILAVLEQPLKPPGEHDNDIPAELAAIAEKALSRDKADRYESAQALADDLKRWQRGGLVRSYEYSLPDLIKKWVGQHKKSLLATAVLLLTVVATLLLTRTVDSGRRARAEKARKARVLTEAREIVANASQQGTKTSGWFDVYLLKLISLKEDVTERYLLTQLNHPNARVRKMVIRALGGMKSRRAVAPLLLRLEKKQEPTEAMIVEIIKTLGVIGAPSSNRTVQKIRWEAGQFSFLWNHTRVAYRMIPVPRHPSLDKMSDEDLYLTGKAYYNKGQAKKSVRFFKAHIARQPKDFRSYNMLGIVYRRLEKNALGIEYFTQSIARAPKRAYFGLNNRGLIYRRIEKFQLALKDYDAALALRPGWSTAHSNRGILHRIMGNLEAAARDYKKAAAIDPRSRTYKYNLASLYYVQRKHDQAMSYIKLSIALEPRNVNSNLLLAHLHLDRGRFEEAKGVLDRLFEVHPQNPALLFAYLVFHYLQRKTAKVRTYVQLLQRIDRPSRQTLKYISLGHFLLGQWSRGLAASEHSSRAHSSNSKVQLYNLIRRLPHLIKLDRFAEFKRLADPLIDRTQKQWVDYLALYLLGEQPIETMEKQAFTAERKFELAFYTGLGYLMNRDRDKARESLKKARSAPFMEKVEWLYAEALLAATSR